MAEHPTPEDLSREDPAPRSAGARRPGPRPLLALVCAVPLALAVGALAVTAPPSPVPVAASTAQSQPGPSSRWCAGPLVLPEGALSTGSDDALSVTPPSSAVSVQSVSAEPASSLLFGTVAGSATLQEEDGSVRAPSLQVADSAGEVLAEDPASQDLGVSVLPLTAVEAVPHVMSAADRRSRPVTDSLQSTLTPSGDYRSLSLTRCGEAVTEASFLGASTAQGDSAALVLRNPTQRPATASVQLWTAAGPAKMEGRSQVVVAPGEEQRVLLESIVPDQKAVGVSVSVLGSPLEMHVQSTEREGLTPGGAEMQSPLGPPAEELVMPGVDMTDAPPVLVLANPRGGETTAEVEVIGPDGPVASAGKDGVELLAGGVVEVPLEGLSRGTYSVAVRAGHPISAVTRSSRSGADLPGDTIGAPTDFALVAPAPALLSHGLTALPAEGAAGILTLAGTGESAVTVIPVAADGSAGEPLEVQVGAGATTSLSAAQLQIDGESAAALTLVPERPGLVHAGWTQRESDGADGFLVSTVPVLSSQGSGDPLTVRLRP